MALAKYMEDEAEATRLYELERKLATAPPPPVMTRAEKIVLASKQRKAPIPEYVIVQLLSRRANRWLHQLRGPVPPWLYSGLSATSFREASYTHIRTDI